MGFYTTILVHDLELKRPLLNEQFRKLFDKSIKGDVN